MSLGLGWTDAQPRPDYAEYIPTSVSSTDQTLVSTTGSAPQIKCNALRSSAAAQGILQQPPTAGSAPPWRTGPRIAEGGLCAGSPIRSANPAPPFRTHLMIPSARRQSFQHATVAPCLISTGLPATPVCRYGLIFAFAANPAPHEQILSLCGVRHNSILFSCAIMAQDESAYTAL